MDTAHLVEALLSGLIYSDEAEKTYPELDRLREWVEGSALLTPEAYEKLYHQQQSVA